MTRRTGPPPGPVTDRWTQAAAEMEAAHADVQPTQMFGSAGLKADGKTFAMIVKGRIVVKLPRDRVQRRGKPPRPGVRRTVRGGAGQYAE